MHNFVPFSPHLFLRGLGSLFMIFYVVTINMPKIKKRPRAVRSFGQTCKTYLNTFSYSISRQLRNWDHSAKLRPDSSLHFTSSGSSSNLQNCNLLEYDFMFSDVLVIEMWIEVMFIKGSTSWKFVPGLTPLFHEIFSEVETDW